METVSCAAKQDLIEKYFREKGRNERTLMEIFLRLTEFVEILAARRTHLYKRASSGKIDMRRTFKNMVQYDGMPLEILYKEKEEKRDVALILDASESMYNWMIEISLVACAIHRKIDHVNGYIFTDSSLREFDMHMRDPVAFLKKRQEMVAEKNETLDYVKLFSEIKRKVPISNKTYIIMLSGLIWPCEEVHNKELNMKAEQIACKMDPIIKLARGFYLLDPITTNAAVDEEGWYALRGKDLPAYLAQAYHWDGSTPVIWRTCGMDYINQLTCDEIEQIAENMSDTPVLGYFTLWKTLSMAGANHEFVKTPLEVIDKLIDISKRQPALKLKKEVEIKWKQK